MVAARTSRIRIGFAVSSSRSAIRSAWPCSSRCSTTSRGRLDVGVGHGTNYNEYEFVGYGLRSDDSRERMAEALEMLIRAWTEAPLGHHGKFYQVSLPALARGLPAAVPADLARRLDAGLVRASAAGWACPS